MEGLEEVDGVGRLPSDGVTEDEAEADGEGEGDASTQASPVVGSTSWPAGQTHDSVEASQMEPVGAMVEQSVHPMRTCGVTVVS